jgi:hypothetical protein
MTAVSIRCKPQRSAVKFSSDACGSHLIHSFLLRIAVTKLSLFHCTFRFSTVRGITHHSAKDAARNLWCSAQKEGRKAFPQRKAPASERAASAPLLIPISAEPICLADCASVTIAPFECGSACCGIGIRATLGRTAGPGFNLFGDSHPELCIS